MEITTQLLDDLWKAQEGHRAMLCDNRRYYKGEHRICGRNEKHADGKPKANVVTNFPEYVVDMYVGAITGMPYQVSKREDTGTDTAALYQEIADEASLNAVDVENLTNALVCGYGLELHEYVDSKHRVVTERPENWALIRDENGEIVFGMTRFMLDKFTMFNGEVLTSDYEIEYAYDAKSRYGYMRTVANSIKGAWQEIEGAQREHYFGRVPLVEWRVTDDRQALLSKALKGQVDEYNDIDSLSGDDIRNVSDALLMIKGISSSWVKDNEDTIKRLRVLPLQDDADAAYLTKTTDTVRVNDRLARCREAIHIMAGVPDIQQVVGVTGGTSGIALQLKFMPMQQRAGAYAKVLEKCMKDRIDLLNSVIGKARGEQIENYTVTIGFQMPINRIEEWQNIGALDGIVTRRTQLELLTDIDDPDQELEQLAQEDATRGDIQALNTPPEVQAAQTDAQVAQASQSVDATIQNALDIIGDRLLAAVTRGLNGR